MIRFISILILLSILSCKGKQRDYPGNIAVDTVMIPANEVIDSMIAEPSVIYVPVDTCCKSLDSLRTELFLANFKIEKVRYYLNICLRNPKQDKFLKGWIRRAIE